jgi:predicted enzyme related to lactoylglutathione lyase
LFAPEFLAPVSIREPSFVVLAGGAIGRRHSRRQRKMANPVVHFEIRSEDPDATRAFFGDLFGWTYPEGALPGYTFVETGAQTIPGGIGPLQDGNEMVTFFVGVQDMAASLAAAKELGGRIVQEPVGVPGVTFALIADPQGHVVGLAQQG